MFTNEMNVSFSAISENEIFARLCVTGFVSCLDPDLEDLNDIKTSVSEAVTNSIIHGYENCEGIVYINCKISDRKIIIQIEDRGKGIKDIKKAMEPLYTSKPFFERAGMGFTVMEAFMDKVEVFSKEGEGTRVLMEKTI